ncbi:MAG: hypothetical protein ACE1ZE_00185 [Candidatus Binatia bacterium]
MKKFLGVILAGGALILLVSAATAQWPGGHGPGRGMGFSRGEMGHGGMGMGHGMRGSHGMGWGDREANCPGMGGTSTATITQENAKELAQKYADTNLPGFKVERVLPSGGMHHTAYAVELKNAEGELRTFHINPFGNVMPFGGPWRSSS